MFIVKVKGKQFQELTCTITQCDVYRKHTFDIEKDQMVRCNEQNVARKKTNKLIQMIEYIYFSLLPHPTVYVISKHISLFYGRLLCSLLRHTVTCNRFRKEYLRILSKIILGIQKNENFFSPSAMSWPRQKNNQQDVYH